MRDAGNIEKGMELLKVMRGQRLSVQELASTTGLHQHTVYRWLKVLSEHGLVDEVSSKAVCLGRAPKLYAVSRQWGGTA